MFETFTNVFLFVAYSYIMFTMGEINQIRKQMKQFRLK